MLALLQAHKLVFLFVCFFRLAFQPEERMDSEIFFLSVNFKIKQNCLTRGVYSDGKPGCLTRPVCNFPSASALAPETTPPGRGTFSKPPFTGPRPGALISLSASVGPGKRVEEGVQRKKCTQRAGEGPHSVPGGKLRSFLRVSSRFFSSSSFPSAPLFFGDLLIWNEIVCLGTI